LARAWHNDRVRPDARRGRTFDRRAPASTSQRVRTFHTVGPETLRGTLRPADVLLIEGNQKIATAIKYLTQSTWFHALIAQAF